MSAILSYQPMTCADLEPVIQIEKVCFGEYWSRRVFEDEISQEGNRLWALWCGSQVVGYSGVWRVLEEAHLTTLAVSPLWRGQHLGELLLWLTLERCRREGAHWLTLEVRPSNQVALKLYLKYGMVEIGRRRRYYPDLEDALVLWRPELQGSACSALLVEREAKLRSVLAQRGFSLNRTEDWALSKALG
ncbi:ribosomal protein S18-alanine N-acetyltransferase [Anthocerotibacter panamensis]|uniref:ribosomal protein S18-alanine N-acetyltransferase n=1 Tax=Anthocerotibacter panamensis TaxID=2857077 RepID=UPI001C4079A0|nr:ribosomal protein S18-alanine N-acetyltransferase [Anthocerotibacter panamensis]